MTTKENRRITIAIDGHAGSGKSTVSKRLGKILGYDYVDTGAMYRAITLKVLKEKVDLDDWETITDIAQYSEIGFNGKVITLDGKDVTEDIRKPFVNESVSQVSVVPGVRQAMAEQQRALASKGGVLVEGRDIGTVVLPNADKKFFLTASVKERSMRRYKELMQKGVNTTYDEVMNNISTRDEIDSTRKVAPLKPAEDAIILDTSDYSINEVVQILLGKIRE